MKRKARTTSLLVLLVVVALVGSVSAQEWIDKPPIKIFNNDPNSQIKVWSYKSGASMALSCQTLGWSYEHVREIEPWQQQNQFLWPFQDHCGTFGELYFYFSVWNSITGEYYDITTKDNPAQWGAAWTWDGSHWYCWDCNNNRGGYSYP